MSTPSVLAPAGPLAAVLAEVGWVLIVGASAVFVIVAALVAWVLRSARPTAGGERRAVQRWIIGGGVLFPTIVLLGVLGYAVFRAGALDLRAQPAGSVIGVTGRLWWWEVRYADPAAGIDFALANEIRIPVGRTVTLGLTSADVIHSFWVPALAGKVDMVPGRVHQLRFSASRPGTYRGQCAEFCGEQHAKMALHVVAMPQADFDRWRADQARPAQMPTDAMALRGWQVFQAQRCQTCHTVRGLALSVLQPPPGPDLTHYASRLHLAAGTLPLTHRNTARWIADPQAVKPGARMPGLQDLDAASIEALTAFLQGLR